MYVIIENRPSSVKYENIYIQEYPTVPLLDQGLTQDFHFFNLERPDSPICQKKAVDRTDRPPGVNELLGLLSSQSK